MNIAVRALLLPGILLALAGCGTVQVSQRMNPPADKVSVTAVSEPLGLGGGFAVAAYDTGFAWYLAAPGLVFIGPRRSRTTS